MEQIVVLMSLCERENTLEDIVKFATLLRDLKINAIHAKTLLHLHMFL